MRSGFGLCCALQALCDKYFLWHYDIRHVRGVTRSWITTNNTKRCNAFRFTASLTFRLSQLCFCKHHEFRPREIFTFHTNLDGLLLTDFRIENLKCWYHAIELFTPNNSSPLPSMGKDIIHLGGGVDDNPGALSRPVCLLKLFWIFINLYFLTMIRCRGKSKNTKMDDEILKVQ